MKSVNEIQDTLARPLCAIQFSVLLLICQNLENRRRRNSVIEQRDFIDPLS